MQEVESEKRLWNLIEKRLAQNSNKELIDKEIWDRFGEDFCVMFTDLSGFSRMVEKFGIIHFLQTIYESKRLLFPIIEKNDGVILKIEGDSFLVTFKDPNKALKSSIEMQKLLKEYNKDKDDEEKVLLCIGLGYGKILKISENDVYGAEVNAASKLGEDTAKSWEILVTESFLENINKDDNISFKEIREIPSGAKKAYKTIYDL
ncbi:MAG: adenylate/guanylate cyclase domain-containing protein [Candidatus Sericytochromatia bacterium]